MFEALVRLHWKGSRAWLIAAMAAAAALPLASVGRRWPDDPGRLAVFLSELDLWSRLYPALAVVLGVAMGVLTWRSDRQTGFVYALTLPLARWRYTGLRLLAGVVWSAAAAGALLVSALVTTAVIAVPATLATHPFRLTAKFGLSLVTVYTMAFAFAALPESTRRNALRAVLLLLAIQFAAVQLNPAADLLRPLLTILVGPAGPLAALGGRWMLIDA